MHRALSISPLFPRAPAGHTAAHVPHPVHRFPITIAWGVFRCISGLWHHRQRSGHPLKNTAVRIPGPSLTEKGMISLISPSIRQ
jgi:hypothetical protein